MERDEFAPPVEDKVKAIAQIIGCDVDELLARAGRVASDLSDIIRPPVGTGGAAADHKGIDNGRHRPAGPQRAEGEGRVRLGANRQKMQMRIGDQ